MAFVPKTFSDVNTSMLAYVQAQTGVTPHIGSVSRTMIEALALEMDEGYFQMAQLLDLRSLESSTGADLDELSAEWDLYRFQPAAAVGEVIIQDENLVTSALQFDESIGNTTLEVDDASDFPTAGFPYTIRVGEGTIQVEDVAVSANDGITVLTSAALVNAHVGGERVSYVDGVADQTGAAGVQTQRSETPSQAALVASTTAAFTIVNGNYRSAGVRAVVQVPGADGNVGIGVFASFVGSAPFTGASVTNIARFAGGRGLETDAELRDRIRQRLQSLSTGNVIALRQAVLGLSSEVTGQRVTTASVFEDFAGDEVIVYVDDGSGFVPDQAHHAETTFSAGVLAAVGSFIGVDVSDLPYSGWLVLSPEDPAQIELVEYSAINYVTGAITIIGVTANAHDLGDAIVYVEMVDDASEDQRQSWVLGQYAVVRNSYRVFYDDGGTGIPVEWTDVTNYTLNRGTGDLQAVAGAALNSRIAVHYDYYTGLIQVAQRALNGDPDDPTTVPGARAAGIQVVVETPSIRRISVRGTVSAAPGFDESALRPLVREAIEVYVQSRGIGGDVIHAKLIERAMSIAGVSDFVLTAPTGTLAILENELPLPYSATGTTLVEIT